MLNLHLSTHAAIDYLGKQQKAHCDISFNNILLRDVVDKDNDVASGVSDQQRKIMEHMMEFRCRRGLLIDFDYSGDLGSFESGSSRRTVCFFH
jgi:thiamine kinase-like enzyme